jgi:hypothetical protein
MIITLQSLALLVTNTCTHELASPRRLIPASATENTEKNATKLTDECISS